VSRISVLSDRVAITIQPDALADWVLGAPVERDEGQETTIITAPIRVQQRGQECGSSSVPKMSSLPGMSGSSAC
jgi:hypothetical protein